jgi:exosortase A-associated hydrolase 2
METFYFGGESRRLFAALSRPSGRARAGLVVCPAFGDEMVTTYARLATWAKELTEKRFAVLRHHPFGTGESDGDCGEFSLNGAADDAIAAIQWMRANVGSDLLGLFGLRLGAAVAAISALAAKPDFVVLWAPIVDTRRYFRELLRWRLAKELVHQRVERVVLTVNDMMAQLEANQTLDLVGYEISPEFYRQMTSGNCWPQQPPSARILWVARPQEETKAESIVAPWRERGARVDLVIAPEPIFWESISLALPRGFSDATFQWITGLNGRRVEGR